MGTVFGQPYVAEFEKKFLNRSGQRSFLFEKMGVSCYDPFRGTITLHTNFVNYFVKSEWVENVFNIRYLPKSVLCFRRSGNSDAATTMPIKEIIETNVLITIAAILQFL